MVSMPTAKARENFGFAFMNRENTLSLKSHMNFTPRMGRAGCAEKIIGAC